VSILSRRNIHPNDKQISGGQINELQRFNKQQRLGAAVVSDEIQIQTVGDPNGGFTKIESIPILYRTVTDADEEDSFIPAKRVKADGTAQGPEFQFSELTAL